MLTGVESADPSTRMGRNQHVAIRTLQVMTDDMDGTELKPGQGQTVRFSFDGAEYAIDLSDKNYKRFAAEIGVWASKAHTPEEPTPPARRRGRPAKSAARPPASDMKAVRDWARDNGYTVSGRGRVSTEIRDAYTAAH